jgi:hypothetical protein
MKRMPQDMRRKKRLGIFDLLRMKNALQMHAQADLAVV